VSVRSYDDRVITDYLLGVLSPAETDQLDEISVADDEFAARLQVLEDELVDAYVRNELRGQTLERFKSHYLASAKRRERVEFARTLRTLVDGDVGGRNRTEDAPRALSSVAPSPARRLFAAPPSHWVWPLGAAALLLVTASSWLALENSQLRMQRDMARAEAQSAGQQRQQLEKRLAEQAAAPEQPRGRPNSEQVTPITKPPVIVAFSLAPPLRGAAELPAISLPADADYVTLQLRLDSAEHNAYRAELKAPPRQQSIWKSDRLRAYGAEATRFVPVTIPRGLLQPRIYVLELSGIAQSGSQEPLAAWSFRVTRP
jgi:hypothetical protein